MKISTFTVSVVAIAVLSSASMNASAERFTIQVDYANKGAVKALTKKFGGNIHLDGNGFIAASFAGKDLAQVKGLLNNPHIKLIEVDQKRSLLSFSDLPDEPDGINPDGTSNTQITPYAIYQSQADQASFMPSAGTKVCIIDSGLDRSNQDFIWNNIDGTININGDNDSGTGNWDENGGPHGTHVAGTIAAADNSVGVIGMASGVALHIVKVFNADGWGYSSDLAYAAQKCTDAGANIISMSLGGGGANSTEENAFITFTDAGGLVVAAAGNDGNTTRSYPAGYQSVMMVGANDADNNIYNMSQHPGCKVKYVGGGKPININSENICVEVTAGGVNTLSTYPAGMATTAILTADGAPFASAAMENSDNASGKTYYMGTAETEDTGANGKICVIDRGNISFHDKVLNCENSGGIGAIIINNEAGMLYGTLGETNATSIPTVGTAFEDRAVLVAASTANISIGVSDYGYMTGTSMATPAVSGIAALVWSNNNGCTGTEIRDALKATAQDSGASGKDVYFGYGIVQAAAADTYLANRCGGGSVTLPPPPSSGGFTLTVDGYKIKGKQKADLTWSGAAGDDVDIFRDGGKIATTVNDGSYTDNIDNKGGGSYTYHVCEAGTSTCSGIVTVNF